MTARNYQSARALCRPLALAGDRVGAAKMLSSLLWHVEAADGGFIGLSDEQLFEKCEADGCLDYGAATASMHAPAPWPVAETVLEAAE